MGILGHRIWRPIDQFLVQEPACNWAKDQKSVRNVSQNGRTQQIKMYPSQLLLKNLVRDPLNFSLFISDQHKKEWAQVGSGQRSVLPGRKPQLGRQILAPESVVSHKKFQKTPFCTSTPWALCEEPSEGKNLENICSLRKFWFAETHLDSSVVWGCRAQGNCFPLTNTIKIYCLKIV